MENKKQKFDGRSAKAWADLYAEHCNENNFSERRGVQYIGHLDRLLIFNNSPHVADPDLRPEEMRRIREKVESIGIAVLATGEGGDQVDERGDKYTATMLLDCGRDRQNEVEDAVRSESASESMVY